MSWKAKRFTGCWKRWSQKGMRNVRVVLVIGKWVSVRVLRLSIHVQYIVMK